MSSKICILIGPFWLYGVSRSIDQVQKIVYILPLQSGGERRRGKRTHRAIGSIFTTPVLSQPRYRLLRSQTLPESWVSLETLLLRNPKSTPSPLLAGLPRNHLSSVVWIRHFFSDRGRRPPRPLGFRIQPKKLPHVVGRCLRHPAERWRAQWLLLRRRRRRLAGDQKQVDGAAVLAALLWDPGEEENASGVAAKGRVTGNPKGESNPHPGWRNRKR